jgi:plasmid maintenance system antidote protein VapI
MQNHPPDPGDILRGLMRARGWHSAADLSERAQLSYSAVSELFAQGTMSEHTAAALAVTFGTSAEYFSDLAAAWAAYQRIQRAGRQRQQLSWPRPKF